MTITPTRPVLHRGAALLAAAGLATALGACSQDQGAAGDAPTGSAPAGDATAKVSVVTSTNTWSDVARAVAGDADVSVTPIIDSNEADPHSYQPSAQDMALLEQADIVVAGGGHYDAWMTAAAEGTDAVIVSALPPDEDGHDHAHEGEDHEGHDHVHGGEGHDGHDGHDHAHGGDDHDGHDHVHGGEDHEGHDHGHGHGDAGSNEHVFYSTDAILAVADDLAKAVNDKAGEAIADARPVHDRVDEITAAKRKLGHVRVAQTHPLGDFILQGTDVDDVTPEGYRAATLDEQEPAAADVNAMLKLIASGDVDVLLDSPQTADAVSGRLVEAAEAAGVPVVQAWETPAKGESFFDLYLATLAELQKTADAAAH